MKVKVISYLALDFTLSFAISAFAVQDLAVDGYGDNT